MKSVSAASGPAPIPSDCPKGKDPAYIAGSGVEHLFRMSIVRVQFAGIGNSVKRSAQLLVPGLANWPAVSHPPKRSSNFLLVDPP